MAPPPEPCSWPISIPVVPTSSPTNLTNLNGTLFFVANDGTHGRELWKTDGTAVGTVLVADIRQGSISSGIGAPVKPTTVDGTLYFPANDGYHGSELWNFVPLTLGDINRDGQRNVADISALMTALSDMNGYQTANGLSNADLLAIADTDGDGHVSNLDIQGLISLLTSAGAGAGAGAVAAAALGAPRNGGPSIQHSNVSVSSPRTPEPNHFGERRRLPSIHGLDLDDSLPSAIDSIVPLISSTAPRTWTSIQGVSLFLEHDPLPLRGLDTTTEQSWQSPLDAVDRVLCGLNVHRRQRAWNATDTDAMMSDMASVVDP